jgi:DNA-directed RNA polymerase specialized sigma24 family protein
MQPSLLAHARALEPDRGEDLLQDAYVRFLEKPPRAKTPAKLKRWFRTVIRNLHFDRHRKAVR